MYKSLTRNMLENVLKRNANPLDGTIEDSKGLLQLLYPAADFPPWSNPMGTEKHLLRNVLGIQFGIQHKAPVAVVCCVPGQRHVSSTGPGKRGRKSVSTCRAGEGSTCLWHLQRSRFH